MLFPISHPRRFCRSCSCCSFLPGRALSCWPASAQKTQQFTLIAPHFETYVRSIFINIASPAPNLAAKTRVDYTIDVTQLLTFLQDRGITFVSQLDLSHLNAFLADMDTRELSG
jgi:hypothetical protein